MITVYSLPGCSHCVSAKRWLVEKKLPFTEVNVQENATALAFLKQRGHHKVPQLYLGDALLADGFLALQTLGEDAVRHTLTAAC